MLVDTEYVRQSGPDPAPEVSRLHMTHRVRVLSHSEGRLIKQSEQRHLESSGDFRPAVTALLPEWIPSTVIGEDGTFRRIEDTAQLQDLVVDLFKPELRMADQIPAFRDHVTRMMSPEGLLSVGRAEWQSIVGQWTGLAVAQELLEVTGSMTIAPAVNVPMKTRIGLIARAPCQRSSETFDCATYQFHQSIARDALAKILEEFKRDATGLGNVRAANAQWLDYEMLMQVTLETGTMLPHDFIQTRTLHTTAELNGAALTVTDVERRHSRFVYDEK